MIVVVVLHVSTPYSRTVLTFVLKILTLISCFEFHMFFNCRNATLSLLILGFTSVSDTPCSSIMLPRYVKIPHLTEFRPQV
uniref:Secreted protein n=1 Tax=Schistosoma curassoni TaxID=6186 RepID=A0A183KET0_9TREM